MAPISKSTKAFTVQSVLGESVLNCRGQTLGDIKDLMVDRRTGRILFAIISFGGFLGLGNKLFAVPWSRIHVDTIDDETVLRLNLPTLENVPRFDPDDWARLSDGEWLSQLERAFPTEVAPRKPHTARPRSIKQPSNATANSTNNGGLNGAHGAANGVGVTANERSR